MLRAGVCAYVTKSSGVTELIAAIHTVAAGEGYLCPAVVNSLAAALRDASGEASHLSPREREVLRLIAEGKRSPAIAGQLHISIGTVEVHRRNVMRKLNLRTVADLTRFAVREGLVAL
jgi:DNA-binding NarL/FixJ family response regulator